MGSVRLQVCVALWHENVVHFEAEARRAAKSVHLPRIQQRRVGLRHEEHTGLSGLTSPFFYWRTRGEPCRVAAAAAEVPVTRKPVSAISRDSIRVSRRRAVRYDALPIAPDLAGGLDRHAR